MGRLMIYSIMWNIYIYLIYTYIYIYISWTFPSIISLVCPCIRSASPCPSEIPALSRDSATTWFLGHGRGFAGRSGWVLPQTFHGNSHKSINLTLWKMAIDMNYLQQIYAGWWFTYPSEKYESQLRWLFPIYRKRKNVPNHQPDIDDTPTQVFSSGNS